MTEDLKDYIRAKIYAEDLKFVIRKMGVEHEDPRFLDLRSAIDRLIGGFYGDLAPEDLCILSAEYDNRTHLEAMQIERTGDLDGAVWAAEFANTKMAQRLARAVERCYQYRLEGTKGWLRTLENIPEGIALALGFDLKTQTLEEVYGPEWESIVEQLSDDEDYAAGFVDGICQGAGIMDSNY